MTASNRLNWAYITLDLAKRVSIGNHKTAPATQITSDSLTPDIKFTPNSLSEAERKSQNSKIYAKFLLNAKTQAAIERNNTQCSLTLIWSKL